MRRITLGVEQARDVSLRGVVPRNSRIVMVLVVRQRRVPVRGLITTSQATALRTIQDVFVITSAQSPSRISINSSPSDFAGAAGATKPEGELLGSTRGADETTGEDGCEKDGLGVESDGSGPCSSSSHEATRKSWLATSSTSLRGEAIPPSNKTKRSTTTSTRLIQAAAKGERGRTNRGSSDTPQGGGYLTA
ncbi:hypothetical protein PR003_g24480 [Phytophthora rubi]|uniref:Uncharacterized protein n=1 Tax=Phytophthora rubi TaxID=129364 RepID=A0A6A4CWJ6_9STRA|nr:hypothetical protein PR003_g24480 [Phytophthora rubi]